MWQRKSTSGSGCKTHLKIKVDCKTVGFFLQISKEVGNAWRKSLMRANRASLTCEAREKKPTVRFPYNEFVPTRGFKMSLSCQKSVHNPALFMKLKDSVIDFEGEYRVLLSALGFESWRCNPVIPKHYFLALLLCEM